MELRGLFDDSNLQDKVEIGCIVAAETIRTEAGATNNHANRMTWAKETWKDPKTTRDHMMMALLASNKDATVANIQGATDASIQTKIDAAVDIFADGS
jgi:hypothetical protein